MTFNVVVRDETGAVAFDAAARTNLSVGYQEISAGSSANVQHSSMETITVMARSVTPQDWHFAVNEAAPGSGSATLYPSAKPSAAITIRHL